MLTSRKYIFYWHFMEITLNERKICSYKKVVYICSKTDFTMNLNSIYAHSWHRIFCQQPIGFVPRFCLLVSHKCFLYSVHQCHLSNQIWPLSYTSLLKPFGREDLENQAILFSRVMYVEHRRLIQDRNWAENVYTK